MTTTTKITIAGIEFTAIKVNDTQYGISVIEYQDYLGLSKDFTRNSNRGKSPELLQEAGIHAVLKTYNVRVGRSTQSFIDTVDFAKLVEAFAFRGNPTARALLKAALAEAIERRIDSALGVSKTEAAYEQKTTNEFREMFREDYQGLYASWASVDGLTKRVEFAIRTNQLKLTAHVPLVKPDDQTQEDMQRYYKAIVRYDTYRRLYMSHSEAIAKLSSSR